MNASADEPKTPPPIVPSTGRVAGIDFGTVRIGVAMSDARRTIASPFEVYTRRSEALDGKYFQQLAQEERVSLFVVGLPVHTTGNESQKSYEARQFGKWLSKLTNVPVVFMDERFSTSDATEHLIAADVSRKKRKKQVDKLAAQIILAAFLESPEKANTSTEPLEG